jgi:chitin disaccharide deacetylase
MVKLIIRADDIGYSREINEGAYKGVNLGIIKNLSFLVQAPEFENAVNLFKNLKGISFGAHLCLTSEWKKTKLSPVLPVSEVPSLVNPQGCFFPNVEKLYANSPNMDEIMKELNAQIDKAETSGLKVSHIDLHMCFEWIPGLDERIRSLAVKRNCVYALSVEDRYPDIEFDDEEYDDLEKNFINKINEIKQGNFTVVGHPLLRSKLTEKFIMEDFDTEYWINRMYQEQKLFSSNQIRDLIDRNIISPVKYEEALLR